ncbi:MAG TPA: phosphatase PAP2 family protein [Robiginitalea sp.]|nr:phosphatase PAP2 family protein [Robiginitalea sp.]
MLKRLLDWDRDTFLYLNGLGIEPYDSFWSAVTDMTTWAPLYVFFLFLLFWKHPRREAWAMTLTALLLMVFVLLLTDLTKEWVERLRPNNNGDIKTLVRILKNPATYSFFSGHASSSFSLTTLMVLYLRESFRWRHLFFIWPLLFALSRIYVGVHYPIDILAGAGVGTLAGILFYRGYSGVILPYIRSGRL